MNFNIIRNYKECYSIGSKHTSFCSNNISRSSAITLGKFWKPLTILKSSELLQIMGYFMTVCHEWPCIDYCMIFVLIVRNRFLLEIESKVVNTVFVYETFMREKMPKISRKWTFVGRDQKDTQTEFACFVYFFFIKEIVLSLR